MSIDSSVIQKIATLSRIKVDANELDIYKREMEIIFNWIEQLDQVDTNDVKPLQSVIPNSLGLREDKIIEDKNQDQVLNNSPNSKFGYFVVPVVVE